MIYTCVTEGGSSYRSSEGLTRHDDMWAEIRESRRAKICSKDGSRRTNEEY